MAHVDRRITFKHKTRKEAGMTPAARRIAFHGDTPNIEYNGTFEVRGCLVDGEPAYEINLSRSQQNKYTGKRWHTQSCYVTITAADWEHMKSVMPFGAKE